MTSQHNIQSGVLPTGRLLATAVGIGGLVGLAWWSAVSLGGGSSQWAAAGLYAAAVVSAGSVLALLAIRPWKRRSLMSWPFVWLAGSGVRMLITLVLTVLLYSAFSLDPAALGIAVVTAYLATLLSETWMYVHEMKVLPPLDESAGASPGVLRS